MGAARLGRAAVPSTTPVAPVSAGPGASMSGGVPVAAMAQFHNSPEFQQLQQIMQVSMMVSLLLCPPTLPARYAVCRALAWASLLWACSTVVMVCHGRGVVVVVVYRPTQRCSRC